MFYHEFPTFRLLIKLWKVVKKLTGMRDLQNIPLFGTTGTYKKF